MLIFNGKFPGLSIEKATLKIGVAFSTKTGSMLLRAEPSAPGLETVQPFANLLSSNIHTAKTKGER